MYISKKLSMTTAYLIGVPEFFLNAKYDRDGLKNLRQNTDASVIRSLCKLRTALMLNFDSVKTKLMYNAGSVRDCYCFDYEDFAYLDTMGVKYQLYNATPYDYTTHWNSLIDQYIDACKPLYSESGINWSWVRNLFVYQGYRESKKQKDEYFKFVSHTEWYPNKMYIHCKIKASGDILSDDISFLNMLYGEHGMVLSIAQKQSLMISDENYCTSDDNCEKGNDINALIDFINSSDRVVAAIDCENSDPMRVYSMLLFLNKSGIDIEKVALFDDAHTNGSWDFLADYTEFVCEHSVIKRIKEHKSLVDVYMTAGICKEYYSHTNTSFLLVSSDSDFYGVIDALPDTNFFVVAEDDKLGSAMQMRLAERNIGCCSLSDFGSVAGCRQNLLREVLLDLLADTLVEKLAGTNVQRLLADCAEKLRIDISDIDATSCVTDAMTKIRLFATNDGDLAVCKTELYGTTEAVNKLVSCGSGSHISNQKV